MKPTKQNAIPAYEPARVDSQNYRPIETILQAEPKPPSSGCACFGKNAHS
jgi:hypothetical protein